MLPDPLHPAIVHFPVVLGVLAPLFAIGALIAVARGARQNRAWAFPVGLLAVLVLSAWVATETGENEEDRVERVVSEGRIGQHEEAAELLLYGSGGVLLVALAGLAPGIAGKAGRGVATLGTVALVAAVWNVGHTGGELVYKQGAAQAYVGSASGAGGAGGGSAPARRGGDDDN